MSKQLKKKFEAIAEKHLHIDTLESRNIDSLDFHEVSVWGVKRALEAAYELGKKETKDKAASLYVPDGNPEIFLDKINKI